MNIHLNGQPTSVRDGSTIGDLIRANGLDPATVVVERNLVIVPTDDWDCTALEANDTLEVLRFVGGG